MNENGTIQTTSWGDINGWAPSVFEFYDSGTATEYVGLLLHSEPINGSGLLRAKL